VPPLTTWPPRDQPRAPQLSSGDVLEGIPGSAGVARGAARIVTDISQAVDLEAGDVLIAPFTDAAWTPLFLSAAAVVVDMGGSVSHAVVVAREFGIPCVVSASNASRLIPQGAMVQVDGTNGLITIL